jgi:hypothetical protein
MNLKTHGKKHTAKMLQRATNDVTHIYDIFRFQCLEQKHRISLELR